LRSISLILCVAIGLSGCIFYPRKVAYNNLAYDRTCEPIHKEMVLDKVTFGKLSDWNLHPFMSQCSDNACLALIFLPVITSASTYVVSGSIVVAGNVVYWLEKKMECAQNGPTPIEPMGKGPVSRVPDTLPY